MDLSKIYAIFIRQYFLIKNNPTRLASIFLWLVIDITEWGFISKYLSSLGYATFNYVSAVLGAIILMQFMTRIQQGVMSFFLEDIWTQNLINYFASPLKLSEYAAGLILSSIATAIIGFAIMIGISGLAFGYNLFNIGLLLLPYMVILFIFGMAMGIFITAVIFRLGPSAEWAGWPVPMVISLFSGVFYPIATLPPFMRAFAAILPSSYVFESMRGIISGQLPSQTLFSNLLIAGILAAIYFFAAYWFFARIYRYNLKHGTIARFNSEDL
jgi:ABC-2 type transport system permease protein